MIADPAPGLDTGRLNTPLHPQAHGIVYGSHPGDGIASELDLISHVDRAHLVMLAEREIVDIVRAGKLLAEIETLRAGKFTALTDRPIPRGIYLAYEGLLAERLGEQVAGVLHTGRSRNDLNATTVRLRARDACLGLLAEVDGLAETLLDLAWQHRNVVMPAFTHGQPAVPITYGHYLAGVAAAVLRGYANILGSAPEIDASPLGAGAVGGTSIAIDPARTAELLGFASVIPNSVDAVASRDFVLRLLAAGAVLGVTLARVARDLATWSTEESGLIRISDDLVGSSSMMPQKRNPFLLEHIQGKATECLGDFMSAAAAMVTAGYTNAIAVGTEAVRHLWPGMAACAAATALLRLVVAGSQPLEQRMLDRCSAGFTTATYQAERLVAVGLPFRTAHHRVGRAVLACLQAGEPLVVAGLDAVDASQVASECAYGGGPGGDTAERTADWLREQLQASRRVVDELRHRWTSAASQLDAAVRRVISQSDHLATSSRRERN